jgi:hypothetical protein
MDALTRLRLLAPADVVAAAERLHTADHRVQSDALNKPKLPLVAQWAELREEQRTAREQLLVVARRALGLGPAQPINMSTLGTLTDLVTGRNSVEAD